MIQSLDFFFKKKKLILRIFIENLYLLKDINMNSNLWVVKLDVVNLKKELITLPLS